MKRTSWIFPAIALPLLFGCGPKQERAEDNRPAVKVQTLTAALKSVPDIHEVVGTVRPKLAATVSAKVMASIEQIPVTAGDTVTAGQLLAKLDDRDLRAEFERAQADYNRFKALLDKQAATRAEFDAVQSRYRVAETALSYATLTAPFTGVVAQKLCDAGDMAAPGKPLFVIEQAGAFRLEAQVPDRFAEAVVVGKSANVVVDATGEKCAGPIAEVVPAADPATRSFLVKIDLDCRQPLRSGMFGRAQLLIGERTAIFVPKSALHERGQLTYLFVVTDGQAQMRLVKPGKEYLDAVEILSGLEPGEKVVVRAEAELNDGARVDEH